MIAASLVLRVATIVVELNDKLCGRCYEAIVRAQKAIDRAFDEALAEKKETK